MCHRRVIAPLFAHIYFKFKAQSYQDIEAKRIRNIGGVNFTILKSESMFAL